MKAFFAILLLFISIAGSFVPCCMEDDCADEAKASTCYSHESHREKGPCSPFFACGTCAVSIEYNSLNIVVNDVPAPSIDHHSFYICQLGTYANSLFQPPRQC